MVKLINTNKLPPKLYHYRSFNNEHIKVITQQTIFFSSPEKYNDPFDCKILPNMNLVTPKQYLKYYSKTKKVKFISEEHKRKFEETIQDIYQDVQESHNDESTRNGMRFFDNAATGILCLSKQFNNILMWGHYSDNHTGFCIGFNTRKLLNEIKELDYFGKVKYSRKYPKIKPTTNEIHNIKLRYFYKSKDWDYEKEYRLLIKDIKNRVKPISKEVLSEIILGCQMDKIAQDIMIREIKTNLPDVKIYKAKRSEKKFSLVFEKVHYDKPNK